MKLFDCLLKNTKIHSLNQEGSAIFVKHRSEFDQANARYFRVFMADVAAG